MLHHKHHTEGFIISSRNMGEANRMLTIYTRELGLVRAMAQGVRLHKSKLRFALQDYAYINVDLVRGRDIWRVTSAVSANSFPYARQNRESIYLMARISKLIERLCDGEEANADIFDDFIRGFHILDNTEVTSDVRQALELHLVLRIMNMLGYIGSSEITAPYISKKFEEVANEDILSSKRAIISYINKALSESQL